MPEWNKDGELVFSADEINGFIYEKNYEAGTCYILEHHVYADIDAMLADVRFLLRLKDEDEIVDATTANGCIVVRYKSGYCMRAECEHVPEDGSVDECPTPEICEDYITYETKNLWKM